MNLYEKKIIYLHREGGEEAIENYGFVSFQCIPGGYKLTVQIRQLQDTQKEGEAKLYFATCVSENDGLQAGDQREEQIEIGKLQIKENGGNGIFRFPGSQEEMKLGERRISVNEIAGVRILLWGEQAVSGRLLEQVTEKDEMAGTKRENILPDRKELRQQTAEEVNFDREGFALIPDKWKQLKQQYELLHPFGDEREFISVKPADFIILRQEYQKLVNNSFLLHGYFNYRHIILGKDTGLCGSGEAGFYLGVPGVFYEREKMVAVMFGFEGFETEGPVETGKFGYYLRKVEI